MDAYAPPNLEEAPLPPAPTGPEFRDPKLTSGLCRAALLATALGNALIGAALCLSLQALWKTSIGAAMLQTKLLIAGYLVFGLGWLVATPTFLLFVYRTNRNARALGAQDLEFSPLGCIGWHFVPVALLWKPYEAIRELFRAAEASTKQSRRALSPPGFVLVWWACWNLGRIVDSVWHYLDDGEHRLASNLAGFAGSALGLVSALLCVRLVSRLRASYLERASQTDAA